MLGFFITIVLLVLAMFLGIAMHQDPGYVLINWHHWRIQSSAWTAFFGLLLLFVVLYYILKLLQATQRFPERLHYWNATRRLNVSRKQSNLGFCALAEGNWSKAEKCLIKGVVQGGSPLMNYLGAARAAEEQGAFDRCETYLKQAYETTPHSDLAVAMTRVKLEIKSGRWEQAVSALQHLREKHPKHEGVLLLLKQVYQQRGDWASLQALLPDLKRSDAMDHAGYQQLAQHTHGEQMDALAAQQNGQGLQDYWQDLSRDARQSPVLVLAYVRHLLALSLFDQARAEIEARFKKNWQPDLLMCYVPASGDILRHQIKLATGWLKHHAKDPMLLLCLAKLHIAERVWGRAKQYLLEVIELQPSREAYILLADVHATLDETAEALKCYQEACRCQSVIPVD